MAEIKKVPAIRFKEFSEDWQEDKFGNRLDIENGYAFKSIYFQDESTNLIVLTPGNVHIGGGFQKNKGRYYSERGEIPSRFILEPDDMFVTMTDLTPTAQTLGYPAVVPNDGNIYLLNQRLGKLVNFEGDKNFLLQILSTEKYHKRMVLSATGTTVKHSSPEKILSTINHFPSINEQTKIGSYFQNLDKLISLHQTKVNKLTNLKKAMLEKMFPKQGADVPEVRFKGFAGAWDEKKLGEVAEFNPKSNLPDVFEYVDLESVIGTQMVSHREETKTTAPSRAQRLARKGDLFYQTVRPYQKNNHLFDLDKHNFVFSTGYAQLRPYGDGYFLLSLVQTDLLVKSVLDNCTGTSYPAINSNALAEIKVSFPIKDEQTKIGCYFKNLDKTISLHQTELEKLNNLKKACLEKMFV